MEQSSLYNTSSLAPNIRQALETLLGRPLKDGECISVRAYEPHEAPTGEARRKAVDGLNRVFAEIDARSEPVSEQEFDEALDEAMASVRPGYTRVR